MSNSEKESNIVTNQRQIIDNYLEEHKEYIINRLLYRRWIFRY